MAELKTIERLPGYEFGDDGSIWSSLTNRQLRPERVRGGYLRVQLGRKERHHYVHRLILEAFAGPPPKGCEACHNNGDRTDNRIENLRWDTRQSNADDRRRHGTLRTGTASHLARLNAEQVRSIRNRRATTSLTYSQIATEFNVSRSTVCNVVNGVYYSDIK